MLELTYKDSKNNIFKVKIDRLNRKLYECSVKTKDEYVETKWNRLFDLGRERVQDFITSKYDDKRFIAEVSYWFNARFGYILKEAKNDIH